MTAPAAEPSRGFSVDSAFAYCSDLTRAHYENFPVASRALPRALRRHVCAIYAFARIADDFADEQAYRGQRLKRLDDWEARLDRALAGRPDHPVFVALAETIRRFELPDRFLRDLLDAFRQDCRVSRYASWEELLDYCRRSANPVGRLVLHLFGYHDEQRGQWSDAICTALQLTNFWQDVAVDWKKDRVYLPEVDRRRHGVDERQIAEGRVSEGFRSLLGELIERTRERFDAGRPLPGSVRGRLALELRCVWHGGRRILDKIERTGYDVFARRPSLSRVDVAVLAGRSLLGGWGHG
jgi:phytoene synthase